jgi:hypothetical protein
VPTRIRTTQSAKVGDAMQGDTHGLTLSGAGLTPPDYAGRQTSPGLQPLRLSSLRQCRTAAREGGRLQAERTAGKDWRRHFLICGCRANAGPRSRRLPPGAPRRCARRPRLCGGAVQNRGEADGTAHHRAHCGHSTLWAPLCSGSIHIKRVFICHVSASATPVLPTARVRPPFFS